MDDPRPTYDECPICHNPVCAASARGITAGTRAALVELVHRKPVPPEPTLEAGRETANEQMVFERLSMALTGGSASTWDQILHAAEQHHAHEYALIAAAVGERGKTDCSTPLYIRVKNLVEHWDKCPLVMI